MQLSVDASAFNAALSRYVQVSRKDHVKILTSKAGDVCLRSAQAAKGGKTADRSKIANIWQTTDWKSKTPWSGKDWWGLFISKLLAVQGFKLNLGRRRVKNQAESDFVSQRSKAAGSAGYYARGTGRWMKKVDGKWKSFKGNRATMTQFRQVTRPI
jgi:hypothetical protein